MVGLLKDSTEAEGGSLMGDCATQPMRFGTEAALTLEAAFDGGASPPTEGCSGFRRWTPRWVCAKRSPSGERERAVIR
jgi:hypothetical protein